MKDLTLVESSNGQKQVLWWLLEVTQLLQKVWSRKVSSYRGGQRCGCASTAQWEAKKNEEKKVGLKSASWIWSTMQDKRRDKPKFEGSQFSTNLKQHIQCNASGNMVGWEVWHQTSGIGSRRCVLAASFNQNSSNTSETDTNSYFLPLSISTYSSNLGILIPLLSG